MTTLSEFLRTGKLGPIDFQITPFKAVSILGEATKQSEKKNPLLLKFGILELTFRRSPESRTMEMLEIAFQMKDGYKPLPDAVLPTDFDFSRNGNIIEFYSYLRAIDYLPIDTVLNSEEQRIELASGVIVVFFREGMRYLGLSRRRMLISPTNSTYDVREASRGDIANMFDEAQIAAEAGILRAALLLAWAGLEAVLRQVAKTSNLQGKIGVQPLAIMRELQAKQKITPAEFQFIEYARRSRTAAAHGLAPEPISIEMISMIINLAKMLMERNEIN